MSKKLMSSVNAMAIRASQPTAAKSIRYARRGAFESKQFSEKGINYNSNINTTTNSFYLKLIESQIENT